MIRNRKENIVNAKEFIEGTVRKLDQPLFEEAKERLVGEYITFSFIDDEKVYINVFAEKLCDYFDKLEFKTGENFDSILKKYMSNWDELVGKRIAKEPATKKNEPPQPVPRAKKYYNHIIEIKKSRNLTIKQLVDYSRIMMCLYTAIIKGNFVEISDFGYSVDGLSIDKIIAAMKAEKPNGILGIGKKAMFDLTDLHCSDTSTFILTMVMYYYIKDNAIEGEY